MCHWQGKAKQRSDVVGVWSKALQAQGCRPGYQQKLLASARHTGVQLVSGELRRSPR